MNMHYVFTFFNSFPEYSYSRIHSTPPPPPQYNIDNLVKYHTSHKENVLSKPLRRFVVNKHYSIRGEEWLNLPLKTEVSVPKLLIGIVALAEGQITPFVKILLFYLKIPGNPFVLGKISYALFKSELPLGSV